MRYLRYYLVVTNEEETYRTSKAAEILKVDQTTVARWIREGEMKAIKLNPNRRNSPFLVPKSEVDRMLRLQKGEGE